MSRNKVIKFKSKYEREFERKYPNKEFVDFCEDCPATLQQCTNWVESNNSKCKMSKTIIWKDEAFRFELGDDDVLKVWIQNDQGVEALVYHIGNILDEPDFKNREEMINRHKKGILKLIKDKGFTVIN